MRRGMVYGVAARAIAERELLGGNLVSPSNHRTKLSAFARVGWASNQCVLLRSGLFHARNRMQLWRGLRSFPTRPR